MEVEEALFEALLEVFEETEKEALYLPLPVSPSRTSLFALGKVEKLLKRKGEMRI